MRIRKRQSFDVKELLARDGRYKPVLTTMVRYRRRPDALIEVLHTVEDVFGYLPLEVMRWISAEMKIPPSRIYGVATFYHFFSLKPKGEHTCVVCTGTACHVKGAGDLVQRLEEHYGIRAGETTEDGKVGIQTVRCLGCCSLAPVAVLDGEVLGGIAPDGLIEKMDHKTGARV